MELDDTIISLCSGAIKSAVSMIRVSGIDAFNMTLKVFPSKKELTHKSVNYGYIKDGNKIVDEVMVYAYLGPHSFTGEDMVEITCHGSLLIINEIIALFIKNGARLATPGEFSKRAFLNGKIDLVKAESINDIVNATNKQAKDLALNGLKGNTSNYVSSLSDGLLDIISQIEVNIDYPEYDDVEQITHDVVLPYINDFILKVDKAIDDSRKGQVIKDGINTVILGRPNVGKSSLLNALLKEDKAIVTSIAGTTRDIVEGKINLNNISLNLIDTAGIHESNDFIEKIGIEKSLESLNKADLVLLVLDNSSKLTSEDKYLLEKTKDKQRIIIKNKSDLGNNIDIEGVNISAFNKDIDNLYSALDTMFKDFKYNDEPLLFNARQEGLLLKAKEHLLDAKTQALNGQVIDIISIDIREAYECILEILGKSNKQDILDAIFSKFCLGK